MYALPIVVSRNPTHLNGFGSSTMSWVQVFLTECFFSIHISIVCFNRLWTIKSRYIGIAWEMYNTLWAAAATRITIFISRLFNHKHRLQIRLIRKCFVSITRVSLIVTVSLELIIRFVEWKFIHLHRVV